MNVGELIRALSEFDQSMGVTIYADPEGLTAMQPMSVSRQKDYWGKEVAFISGWEDPPAWEMARVLI